MSISGKSEAMTKRITSYYSCVEPSANMQRKAKDNILAGCGVVQTNASNVTLPIMNTGTDTRVLRKGTVIDIMKATSKVSEDPRIRSIAAGRDASSYCKDNRCGERGKWPLPPKAVRRHSTVNERHS